MQPGTTTPDEAEAEIHTARHDGIPQPATRGATSLPRVLRVIRATAIIPVVLMGLGAAVAYAVALLDLIKVVATILTGKPELPSTIVELVRVVDICLVGMLMSILAFGIYELFIASIAWPLAPALVVRDIADLERRVAQTVVVILGVTALDVVVQTTRQVSELEVVGSIALAILAITLYLRLESPTR
jgi:uncharacterized membrane protein YqhA